MQFNKAMFGRKLIQIWIQLQKAQQIDKTVL